MAFENAVNAAVDARRAAVDMAIDAFRAGVTQAIAQRKEKADKAVATFESSMHAAFENAKSNCGQGMSQDNVRSALFVRLASVRKNLKTDSVAIEKLQPGLVTLAAAKKLALAQAVQDFRITLEKARVDLKKTFPGIEAPKKE